MAINDVLGLSVDVSATTDNFVRALREAASRANLDLNVADPLIRSFKSAQADIKGIFAKTVSDAASAGLGRASLDKFIGKLQPLTDNIESSMKRIFEQEAKIRKGGLDDAAKRQIQDNLALEREKLRGLQVRLKMEQVSADKIIKRRKQAQEEAERLAARTRSEAVDEFSEGLTRAFEDLKSGNLGNLLKGAGKRGSAWGEGLKDRGVAKGGMMGGMMKGLGEFLSKAGPMIAALGAIAAGFAAVIAMVIQADSAVKDLNRTILSAGMSGKDLGDKYNRLGTTMTQISQQFMDSFAFNRIWGTTAKDHLEILGAYAEAGLTFQEMAEGIKSAGEQMEVLKKHTVAALTYSKLLGLSTTEISQTIATYMTDLGFTLEGVEAKFSNIAAAAKESGFATKRFFNMVLQATTGMSMYNVRLEEAAGLLTQLGKILGEKMGGDFLQQLTRGFKDENTLDRVRKTMTTGLGYSINVLKKDALKTSEEFVRKLEDLSKSNAEGANKFNAVLDEFKLKGLSSEDMIKKLSTMNESDRKELLAKATAVNAPMGRMLAHLSRQAVVQKGTLGAAQAAREGAGAGATLLLQMNELRGVLGKRIDEIRSDSITQRAAFEQITGKSGEEFRKLASVAENFAGRQKALADAQAEVERLKKEGKEGAAEEYAKKFNEQFGKSFGILLGTAGDQLGKRFTAKLDSGGAVDTFASFSGKALGDTLEDLVMNAGEGLLGGEDKKVAEDILLAQEIAANTTDISKILEQGVEWLLSQIYKSVQYIASFFGKSEFTDEEKKAKGQALGDIQDKLNEARMQMAKQESAIKDLERKKRTATSDDEKAKIEDEIARRRKAVEMLGSRSAVYTSAAHDLGRLDADVARPYGKNLSRDQLIGIAAAQPGTRGVMSKELERLSPGAGAARINAMAGAQESVRQLADKYAFFTKQYTLDEQDVMAKRAEDEMFRSQGSQLLGLGSAVRPVDNSMLSAWELSGQKPEAGVVKSTAEVLGDLYIKEGRDADQRSKKELTEEEKQKKEQTKQFLAGMEKLEGEKEDKQLAALMASVGVPGSPESLLAQAKMFRQTGTVPTNISDLSSEVVDPATGQTRRLGDILRGSPSATAAMNSTISKKIGSAPMAHDFLMQVGSDGRVKFAQRIDGADTVAVATKAGGAVAAAAGRSGGGGVTIIQHNYSDMEAIKKGYKALMAARALG